MHSWVWSPGHPQYDVAVSGRGHSPGADSPGWALLTLTQLAQEGLPRPDTPQCPGLFLRHAEAMSDCPEVLGTGREGCHLPS